MIAKYSVKKPFTVVVGVVLILILGIVSFTKMTPDLLPSITLPYAMVSTVYVGATPEEVETTITKPVEQAMATLSGISSIQSVSSENYSMVILEFEEDANMDSKTVEMREKLDSLKENWPDGVGNPSIMKVNPDMLPVVVAAADVEGMDAEQVTDYMNEFVIPQIEGTEGVAAVNASGQIETHLEITLSPEKMEKINARIRAKVEEQLDTSIQSLEDAKAELESTRQQLEAGNQAYQSGLTQADQGFTEARMEILKGEITIAAAEQEINASEQELYRQMEALTGVRYSDLDSLEAALRQKQTELIAADAELSAAEAAIVAAEAQMNQMAEGILGEYIDENGNLILPDFTLPTVPETSAPAETETNAPTEPVTEAPTEMPTDPPTEAPTEAPTEVPTEDPTEAPTEAPAETTIETPAETIPASGELPSGGRRTVSAGNLLLAEEPAAVETSAAETTAEETAAETTSPVSIETIREAYESWEEFQKQKEQVAEARKQLDAAKEGIDQALAGIAALRDAKNQMAQAKSQLEIGKSNLLQQEISTRLALNQTGSQLQEGMSQVQSGQMQIDSTLSELQNNRESTLSQTDITQILTMDQVANILQAQNFSMPAGYIKEDETKWLIRVGNKLQDKEEVENLLLFDLNMEGIDPIYLKDVADISYEDNRAETYAKINGKDAVLLSISKQSNYSTAEVSGNVGKTFEMLESKNPDLEITMLSDQGDYIDLVVGTVLKNLLYGAALAILVLILFLKDIRPTIIIACSIPISVVFAFVLMYFSHITLNVISLSGLAIGVGMLVDNSVVVIENIFRLRNKGFSAVKAAVTGTVQVVGSITASTLTTVCVFLPIVFIEGITRELFTDMALTVAYSLLASLIVAVTLVPMMSAVLLKPSEEGHRNKFREFLQKCYVKVLKGCLKFRLASLLLAIGLLVFSVWAAIQKGTLFMPSMDSTQISVSISMPDGSHFSDTVEIANEVTKRVENIEGVQTVGAMVGGGLLLSQDSNGVQMYVILDENKTRSSQEIAAEINEVCKDLPAEVTASGSSSMDMSALTGSGISIRVTCNDLDLLQNTARQLAEELKDFEGIAETDCGIEDPTPELRIVVRKNDAMKQGLTVAQVYMEVVKVLSTSKSATTLVENQSEYEVVVSDSAAKEMTKDEIGALVFNVKGMDGTEKEVALKDVADIEETTALSSISRYEQKRYLTVTGTLKEGYNVGIVSNEIASVWADRAWPEGISIEYTGENESIQEAFTELLKMLLLAVAFIYLIMVAQFQSLKSPFIVMFTIPLAFTGGFLALYLAGMEVSVISLLGFVMLSGIIVNNGIVLVDFINQLRLDGMEKREAIVEAGITRMRPILMTAITTILGLLTMAMGVGMGSEMMQPIAVVTVGGLTYATFMTLFIVPVLYDLFNRREMRKVSEEDLIVEEDA